MAAAWDSGWTTTLPERSKGEYRKADEAAITEFVISNQQPIRFEPRANRGKHARTQSRDTIARLAEPKLLPEFTA